jgi:tripartite-type tricarboxylate transporter receptor subunit TctC
VAQSPPDGYTVLQSAPAPITTFPHLQKLAFDPLKDLAPVTLAVRFVLVWAKRPGLEVNSIPELVALQKRKEKEGTKLTVGYSGIGGRITLPS